MITVINLLFILNDLSIACKQLCCNSRAGEIMNYRQVKDKIILKDINSFNIEQILECGQCFRFYKISEGHYLIIAKAKVLKILQTDEEVIFYPATIEDFKNLWISYFDLNRDYDIIKQRLAEKDQYLNKAIDYAPGIRILNQDPWECLISFIISQNKQIPHIKQVVNHISRRFGQYIDTMDNIDYFAFPTAEELSKAKEEDLRACKAGFRAPYILDACKKIKSGEIDLEKLKYLPYEEAKTTLLNIKGVGPKIADCVLLFAFGKWEAFPVDIWIKRIMESLYFNREISLNEIGHFAREQFGNYAGLAQQYLFYYGRQLKIGK